MTLHTALVSIFGGEPDEIRVSHPDHLAVTLSPAKARALIEAAGGRWLYVLDRIDAYQAERQTWKDPGADKRLEEAKP